MTTISATSSSVSSASTSDSGSASQIAKLTKQITKLTEQLKNVGNSGGDTDEVKQQQELLQQQIVDSKYAPSYS